MDMVAETMVVMVGAVLRRRIESRALWRRNACKRTIPGSLDLVCTDERVVRV